MSWEGFKNILLAVLIAISGLLTLSMWFYQPEYESIDRTLSKEILIQERLDADEIIKPTKMIYHQDNRLYGTTSEDFIVRATEAIHQWKLYNFHNRSAKYNKKSEFDAFMNISGTVDLVFNDSVPLSFYKNYLKVEGSNLPAVEFDRIKVLADGGGDPNNYSVYFFSMKNQTVVEAKVDKESIDIFRKDFMNTKDYAPYKELKITANTSILVPAEKTKVEEASYLVRTLSLKQFKEALFPVQSNVKQEADIYTDATSFLRKDSRTQTFSFKNGAATIDSLEDKNPIDSTLQRSIEFINTHAGWDSHYRYASITDKEKGERITTFRLYAYGLPIFDASEEHMTEIIVKMGASNVQSYERPYISPTFLLNNNKVELPSGEAAYEEFKAKMGKQFNPKLLEDMTIGYLLDYDPNESLATKREVYTLKPSWFFLYNNSWTEMFGEEQGGVMNGLE